MNRALQTIPIRSHAVFWHAMWLQFNYIKAFDTSRKILYYITCREQVYNKGLRAYSLLGLRHRKEVFMKTVQAIPRVERAEMKSAFRKAVIEVAMMTEKKGSEAYKKAFHKAMIKAYRVVFGSKSHKYFKTGNSKLDKNCYIWDIAEGITCKGLCSGCYAVKASRQYPQTAPYRLMNTILSVMAIYSPIYRAKMLADIERQVKKARKQRLALRLHSAGDMFCYNYWLLCNEMAEIVSRYGIKAYTYTKFQQYQSNEYINVVESIIIIDGKAYINYGNKEYMQALENDLKAHGMAYFKCSYGSKDNKDKCMKTCFACLHYKHVLFDQH